VLEVSCYYIEPPDITQL